MTFCVHLYLHTSQNSICQKKVLVDLLQRDRRTAIYVGSFSAVEILSLDELENLDVNERIRAARKILMYWAILSKAGYDVNERDLPQLVPQAPGRFRPRYRDDLRLAAYLAIGQTPPATIDSLNDLRTELDLIADYVRNTDDNDDLLRSRNRNSNRSNFESDEKALLNFLNPPSRHAGVSMLRKFRQYHNRNAGDFVAEILEFLDNGNTVILDLGNADPQVRSYFSEQLSKEIFYNQVEKFSNNRIGNHYVQLYFEEAHNLFPRDQDKKAGDNIYSKIAKEEAKYHIGMVYSTQSVTSIDTDLLNQTENFFIAHLSSQDEVKALSRVNVAYDGIKDDILKAKTKGYIQMLTRSHRFVVPVQVKIFHPINPDADNNNLV